MNMSVLINHPFKSLVLVVGVSLAVLLLYAIVHLAYTLMLARELIREAQPYTKDESGDGPSIVVLGDSTAVGVGAQKPEDSIAGRISEHVHASFVENHAVSGARVKDLPDQISKASHDYYDIVLIQIGANDIVSLKSPTITAQSLLVVLNKLPSADQVLVLSAGDVGGATGVPFFMRGVYTWLNLRYHEAFTQALGAGGYTYINLYESPRGALFYEQPKLYLAADGFHPSSEGYGIWFDTVQPHLMRR